MKRTAWCLLAALIVCGAPAATAAQSPEDGGKTPQAHERAGGEAVNNGQDMTRPLTRVDLRYEYQNSPHLSGSKDDAHIVTVRMDKPFDLGPRWKLATRLDLPLMFTDRVSKDNTQGNTHFGVSDVLAQAMLVNIASERFAWAAGAQIILPTATEDEMGMGKYRVVPTLGMRWATPEMLTGSWVALAARWDKDFAESRSDATKVNELQLAPMVNIPLPDQWFVNLFPSTDIRCNLGDKRPGDSGRWFVPANVLVGKMLTRDIVTSVEVGVPIIQDYHVYDFKVEARIGFFF
ncbi:conserved exported hypothetical protein [uncultured delta proteobacterium]|uniref:Transporter n=1 Tax=uncultured delta proteobacterium TaxID=34034 RepID=A0A212KFG0_9DELT|nr:conserved exported hypothetical protein [uncultured delta proteobacterium]